MIQILNLILRHKGKTATGTLALVVYLLSRGCDVRVHVDPVHARTNDQPAEITPP